MSIPRIDTDCNIKLGLFRAKASKNGEIMKDIHEQVLKIRQNRKFVILPAKVYTDNNLNGTDMRVLGVLSLLCNNEHWCWPSVSLIAALCNIDPETSKRSIQRSLKNLVDMGYILKRERFRKDGSNTSNMYMIVFDDTTPPQNIPEEDEDDIPCHWEDDKNVTPPLSSFTTPKNQYNINQVAVAATEKNLQEVSPPPLKAKSNPKRKLQGDMEIPNGWYSLALAEGLTREEADTSLKKLITYYAKKGITKTEDEWKEAVMSWCEGEWNKSNPDANGGETKEVLECTPPEDDGTPISKFRMFLYNRCGPKTFETWLKQIKIIGNKDNKMIFGLPNKFIMDCIDTRYKADILDGLHKFELAQDFEMVVA